MPVVLFLNAPRAMNHAGMATASSITTGLKKVLCNTGCVFGDDVDNEMLLLQRLPVPQPLPNCRQK